MIVIYTEVKVTPFIQESKKLKEKNIFTNKIQNCWNYNYLNDNNGLLHQ